MWCQCLAAPQQHQNLFPFTSVFPASAQMCNILPASYKRHYSPQVCYAEVQAVLLVYNDAVTALVSGTDGQLDGCVLIAGTGLYCCLLLLHLIIVLLPMPQLDLAWMHLPCSADRMRHSKSSVMRLHADNSDRCWWQLIVCMRAQGCICGPD